MRIGVVRSDVKKIYLADVENTSQRNFSSEPAGQSRNLSKPTDAQFEAALKKVGSVAVLGSNTAATVDTSANNTLRIRRTSVEPYTVITVPAGATTAKTAIASVLAQSLAPLGATAAISGTNQIVIYSTGSNQGPDARLQIDSVANGSTLSTALGFTAGGVTLTGLAVSALKTAVYPTPTTINVATATITALSSFNSLPTAVKNATVATLADLVAPRFAETTKVVKSATSGMAFKMAQVGFRPAKGYTGLPAGAAVVLLKDDGSTPWT